MRHILSVSLGSSQRFIIERRGTDGSLKRFAECLAMAERIGRAPQIRELNPAPATGRGVPSNG